MRYSDLPVSLDLNIRGNVTEHEDGSISVDGDVNWSSWFAAARLCTIPIKFRSVSGSFACARNHLSDLNNAPDFIGGNFWCFGNKLTSLDGLGEVKGSIKCENNLVSEKDLLTDYRQKRAKKELMAE